jgi:signal transduction histidine kinase
MRRRAETRRRGFRRRRWHHSLFTKLLLVIIVAGVCLNLIMGAFFHHAYRRLGNSPLKRNLAQYIHYLVADMGVPPTPQKAQALAAEAGLQIWYEGARQAWSTTPKQQPDIEWADRHGFSADGAAIRYLRYHGLFYVRYEKNGERFTFSFTRLNIEAADVVKGGIFILLAFSLTLAIVFFFVRRIHRPVGCLTRGVHQVAAGHLDHRVPESGVYEFAQLARAFNSMTARIKASLESREQLLLDVSHELRSPITRMRVALEFLPDSKAKTSLAEDVTVLEELVGQILEGARTHHKAGQLNPTLVDLGEAVRTAVAGFDGRHPKIHVTIPGGDWQVSADEAKVQTVLSNLLENALKYSRPESGPVRVEVRRRDEGVEIRVTDQGIGIPAEDLKHILEPFYRVDKSRTKATGGYGLGLSLCNTIMEAHQGKLTITSKPGRGTTATLLFPTDVTVS